MQAATGVRSAQPAVPRQPRPSQQALAGSQLPIHGHFVEGGSQIPRNARQVPPHHLARLQTSPQLGASLRSGDARLATGRPSPMRRMRRSNGLRARNKGG